MSVGKAIKNPSKGQFNPENLTEFLSFCNEKTKANFSDVQRLEIRFLRETLIIFPSLKFLVSRRNTNDAGMLNKVFEE